MMAGVRDKLHSGAAAINSSIATPSTVGAILVAYPASSKAAPNDSWMITLGFSKMAPQAMPCHHVVIGRFKRNDRDN